MTSILLAKNKELLSSLGYNPGEFLTDEIDEIESTRDGYKTFRHTTCDGKKIYVHSKYDVFREIEGALNEIPPKKDALYIVYGLGFGYHIKELKKRISRNSFIFVLEKEKRIISTYMRNMDFSELMMDKVHYCFGDEKDILVKINDLLKYVDTLAVTVNLYNIIIPSYSAIYSKWISEVHTRVLDVIKYGYFNMGNDVKDTFDGIYNNYENIKELMKSPSIEFIGDTYQNTPVIIVGAGPSLNKNIAELKSAVGRALIFSTDAALSTLRRNGVIPDAVFSVERGIETYDAFYKDKNIEKEVVFVGPPVVKREIFESLKGNKKLLCLKKGEKINEWINDEILQENRLLFMGASCTHSAFSFAQHLGANPVIFIGQDMAFSKLGVTHAEGVEAKLELDLKDNPEIIYVKGIDGDLLPTNIAYKNFMTWLETEIGRDKSGRIYIDATEGGAYKNGTVNMKLKDTIEAYCKQEIIKLCDIIPGENEIGKRYDKAIEEVRKIKKMLSDVKMASAEQMMKLQGLQEGVLKKVKLVTMELKEILKVLDNTKEIEKLMLQNDVLRTIFQAIFTTSLIRFKKIGYAFEEETIRSLVKIQADMYALTTLSCLAGEDILSKLIGKMEDERCL